MSKFAFVIEITKSGDAKGHAYKKEDAQKAKDLFNKLREEGKEAYYYQHPQPDKRCKSEAQMDASKGTEGTSAAAPAQKSATVAPEPQKATVTLGDDLEVLPNPSSKKNNIGGF